MELTSPLTTAQTRSPKSFHTAPHSAIVASEDHHEADTTIMTTPDDVECHEEKASEEVHEYQKAIEPPFQLKFGIQIHLEEQLYSQALTLLEGLLADHTKRIATPSQLAFLTTMAIHPHFTSRPAEGGRRRDGNHALTYLRGLISTVGPLNANFKQAFSFHSKNNVRAKRRQKGKAAAWDDDSGSSSGWGEASDSDSMNCPFARDELVFLRAENFWSVLGWSFRCAAVYPGRWKFWKEWLDLVLEVVETDWDERLRLDEEEAARGDCECEYTRLRQSIMVDWLEDLQSDRKNVLKDVLRALLSFTTDDNGDKSVFGEIFGKETVVGPRKLKKRKADIAKLDLENDMWGDYMDNEESESDPEQGEGDGQELPVLRKARRKPAKDDVSFRLTDGIAETVPFRLRIFRLLSAAAHYLPDKKFFSTTELYQSFSKMMRNLPLPLFPLFVEANNNLPVFVKVSLYRKIAEDLLPPNSPDPDRYDEETNAVNGISPVIMENCFLPLASGRVTAEDNAKLSIVLENMMWVLVSQAEIDDTIGIIDAIDKGITAREAKVKRRGASNAKLSEAEQMARDMMDESSANLRLVATMLEEDYES